MRIKELDQAHEENSMTAFYIGLSDLMVLLLVFFLMIISMSKIDSGSFEKVKTGITGSTEGTLVELAGKLKAIIEGQPGVPGVKVGLAADGLRLDLDSAALFDSGSAKLRVGSLDPIAPVLLIIQATHYTIDIEGHSDDVPLHRNYKIDGEANLETNWSLSGRRASSVINFLQEFGFKDDRMRVIGYASTRPNHSIEGKSATILEEARALNRRVSLLIK